MARGAPSSHMWASSGGAGTSTWKRTQALCGQLLSSVWWGDEPQSHGCQIRRLPSCFWYVEDSCRALLHLDWRFPAFRSHQGYSNPILFILYINLNEIFSKFLANYKQNMTLITWSVTRKWHALINGKLGQDFTRQALRNSPEIYFM